LFTKDPTYKRLAKYSILLSIKESYLFTRNSLGLIFHPFKTLYGLFREQDFSQIALILGFPAYVFFGGLMLIWLGRRLIHAPIGVYGFFTKGGILGIFLISSFIFFYLGFWLYRIWKVKTRLKH
jgi:hypothetical protein